MDAYTKNRNGLVYLSMLSCLSYRQLVILLKKKENLDPAFLPQALNRWTMRYAGLFPRSQTKKIQALMERFPFEQLQAEYRRCRISFLTLLDHEYPACLLHTYQPPLVLFYKGEIKLLQENLLAIVGSRIHTAYAKTVLDLLLPALAEKKIVTVSGLAKGIDGLVHQHSIQHGGRTIGIIACGLDVFYPTENEKIQRQMMTDQLVLTEYPLHCRPMRHHFPLRNRIIASLAPATLVIEAKAKSGSLITANLALQENRQVFAVPGNITSSFSAGTNELIRAGAIPVLGSEDIFENMKWIWHG